MVRKNDKDEAIQVERKEIRKKLELEAKLYQDGQTDAKKELVRMKTNAKVIEFAEIEEKCRSMSKVRPRLSFRSSPRTRTTWLKCENKEPYQYLVFMLKPESVLLSPHEKTVDYK